VAGCPLVTGATGFAGSHLLDDLLLTQTPVTAWGHPAGRPVPTTSDARVDWRAVDLLDAHAVADALGRLRPGVIYHCAGVAHVAASWTDAESALRVNGMGTHHLLDGLRAAGHVCPVLIVGSALVYRPSESALTEDEPLGPSTPYGVSKLAQEMLGTRAVDLPVFIARPFNHAGPRQSHDFVTSSFARQIAEIEAGMSEPVLRVGNLTSRRDITDVRDTVRAYRLIVECGQPRRPYNVCAGQAYCVSDLLEMLMSLSHARVTLENDRARMRPSDNPVILGDRTRIASEVGWQPEIPIERTLSDLLDYWRQITARSTLPRTS
jgi:GDP-4-dehydro-6-deoxy-D-mannose reductase